jgi:hypothetical protein
MLILSLFGADADDETPDEREVPVPFANVCECGAYKHEDNYMCDDCWVRTGGEDHQ